MENTDQAQTETKETPTEQETTQTDEQTEEAAAPTPAPAPEPAKAAVAVHKFNPDEIANQKAEEEEKQFKTLSKADKLKHFEQSRNEGLIQAALAQKTKNVKNENSIVNLEIEDPGAASKVAEEGA